MPIPRDLVAQIPAFLLIAIMSYAFKYSTERVDHERKLHEQKVADERRLAALGDALGFMAHELNTPLATIRAAVSVLRARSATGAPDIRSALHDRLKASAERRGAQLASLFAPDFAAALADAGVQRGLEALFAKHDVIERTDPGPSMLDIWIQDWLNSLATLEVKALVVLGPTSPCRSAPATSASRWWAGTWS